MRGGHAARCILVLATVALATLSHAAKVERVYPVNFGVNGGARLTVHGSGFSRDGAEGTTSVYVGTRECVQDLYQFNDGQIVCEVPPQGPGSASQAVTVAITAIDLAEFASCGSVCNVAYREDRTPRVTSVTSGAAPYATVRVDGTLMGCSVEQYDIYIGGAVCDPSVDLNDPDTCTASGGDVYCYAPADQTPGVYNVSMRVRRADTATFTGFGHATIEDSVYSVDWDSSVYMTSVHAEVHALSYQDAGTLGGAPLTITGAGFGRDMSRVDVRVAGAPCAVTSMTPTSIVCTPAAAPASQRTVVGGGSGVMPGGRGVRFDIYEVTSGRHGTAVSNAIANLGTAEPVVRDIFDTSFALTAQDRNNYVTHAQAFFVPPVTANYSFWSRGDDYVDVRMQVNQTVGAAMQEVAHVSFYKPTFFSDDRQRGAPVYLQAGVPYFMEAWHYEGGGADWFDVAVRVHQSENFTTTPQQRALAWVKETQQYRVDTDVVREVQAVTVMANSGKFRIGVEGDLSAVTSDLEWDATNSQVDSAVQTMRVNGCRRMQVTRTQHRDANDTVVGHTWEVKMQCATATNFPLLKVLNVALATSDPAGVQFSVSRLVEPSVRLGGVFRFGPVNNTWTEPISLSTSLRDHHIEAAIHAAFPDIAVNVFSFSYNQDALSLNMEYLQPTARDMPLLGLDLDAATGTNVSGSAHTFVDGSADLFYERVPAYMLRVPAPGPQATVTINGVRSTCPPTPTTNPYGEGPAEAIMHENLARCAFHWHPDATPSVHTLSSSSPHSNATHVVVTHGDTVTVAGAGIGTSADMLSVSIGDAPCAVTAAADDSITCTVGHGAAGAYAITVNVLSGAGLAALDGVVTTTTTTNATTNATTTSVTTVPVPHVLYAAHMDALSPVAGSNVGGTHITIVGAGFDTAPGANVVTVGATACEVIEATHDRIVCTTPSRVAAAPANDVEGATVQVSVNGNTTTGFTFQYQEALTPTVTAASPDLVPASATFEVTINGSRFCSGGATTADGLCAVEVRVGNRTCTPKAVTDASIVCHLPRFLTTAELAAHGEASAGTQPVVRVVGLGTARADAPSESALDTRFVITSIDRHTGSMEGGTNITIQGAGFRVWYADTTVKIDVDWGDRAAYHFPDEDPLCTIVSITDTEIRCVTTAYRRPAALPGDQPRVPVVNLHGRVTVIMNLVEAACLADCGFNMSTAVTPNVTTATPEDGHGRINVTGTGFAAGTRMLVGGRECDTVEHASDTHLSCRVPANVVGMQPVVALVPGVGFSYTFASYHYMLSVTSLSATIGSTAGHTTVTVRGAGFSATPSANRVTFGDGTAAATVVAASHTELTVLTPPQHDASATTVAHVSVAVLGAGAAADGGDDGAHHHRRRRLLRELGHMHGNVVPKRNPAPVLTGSDTPQASSLHAEHPLVRSVFASVSSPGTTFDEVASIVAEHHAATTTATAVGAWRQLSADDAAVLATATLHNQTYTFDASLDHTPRLLAVAHPSPAIKGDIVTLTAQGVTNDTVVTIAGAPCAVQPLPSWNASAATTFNCTLGDTPGGYHAQGIRVVVPGKGAAAPAAGVASDAVYAFTAGAQVATTAPHAGGFGGNTLLTVTGHGFVSDHVSATTGLRNEVAVCDVPCDVQSASYDTLTCRTPARTTASSVAALDHTAPTVLHGTVTRSGGLVSNTVAARAFDGDVETNRVYTNCGACHCSVGLDFGAGSAATMSALRFFPRYWSADEMEGGVFEASNDGGNWTTLGAVGLPHEGWNTITLDTPSAPARFVRFASVQGCNFMELEFVGVKQEQDGPCNVTVDVVDAHGTSTSTEATPLPLTAPSTEQFSYEATATPMLTAVSPAFGTARGGTSITITGTGFTSSVDVVIDGHYPCAVTATTATTITCTTAPRPKVYETSLVVTVAGRGTALTTAEAPVVFRYLDLWSDLGTWTSREPPVAGDSVVIPTGQTVLMDVSPPELFLLLVQGDLIFDSRDLNLDASYIYIQGGTLEVGTEAQPYTHRATITLHGDRFKSVEIPHVGSKVLCVADKAMAHGGHGGSGPGVQAPWNERGVLDLHGIPRVRTWTKLAASSMAGDDLVHTAEDVDFARGETVIITSNARGNPWATEERVVAELVDARTIRLTEPLSRDHVSEMYTGPDGRVVDMRLAVGLLSRNIVVRGDSNSVAQRFGAHTMAAHGGTYRVQNIELTRCGQASLLGRYCTHTHMAGGMGHSYVLSNSIHHSFQRANTIHGTHHLRVKHNVAYDVKGHTYFVEDGVEMFNVVEENLGAKTRALIGMLKSDASGPATFWTAGPTNYWRHNVAAGSAAHGFWFELPGAPHGPSFSRDRCPHSEPLGEFLNNTVYSNGNMGLRIYPHFTPLAACGSSVTAPAHFRTLTSFRNGGNGVFCKKCGDVHMQEFSVLENGGHGFSIKIFKSPYQWDPNIKDALVVGNRDPALAAPSTMALWAPQDEFFYVSGFTTVNWHDSGAIGGCNACDSDQNLKQGAFTVRFDRMAFVNTSRWTRWTAPRKQIFWDLDGTLTGHANGTVTPYLAFNNFAGACPRHGDRYDDGIVCDGTQRVRRLAVDGVEPREMDFRDIVINSTAGLDAVPFRPKEFYGWAVPIVANKTYTVAFDTLVDWRSSYLRFGREEYLTPGEYLQLAFPYIDARWQVPVTQNGRDVPWRNNSAPLVSDRLGTAWNDVDNSTWHIVLNTVDAQGSGDAKYAISTTVMQCPPGGCPIPPPPTPGDSKRWSQPSTWPSGQVPRAGEDVVIPADMWVLLDVDTPVLNEVSVEGKLSFEDERDLTLEAYKMAVWGTLQVGTRAEPHTHAATIRLHGVRTSPTLILDNALFLGNKVMAVLGNLQLHGTPVARTWVRLAAMAEAGATELVLDAPVAWHVGDNITVTPTEYDIQQLEDATVAAVSDDGLTVTLTAPLTHRHFAGSLNAGTDANGNDIRAAAAVGLLTRSVRVEGALASPQDTYGAHIVVADIVRNEAGATVTRTGVADVSHTEFRHCGKGGMEHASLRFQYSADDRATVAASWFTGCAFSNNFNYAVVADQAPNFVLHRNVFHRNQRTAVDILPGSTNVTLTENLVAGAFRFADETEDWLRPTAGFYVQTLPFNMSGNVVAAGADTGYTLRADACNSPRARINHNEAHAVMVGVHLLRERSGCYALQGWRVWKAAHVGIQTVDQRAAVQVSDVVVADSHIGLMLHYLSPPSPHVTTVKDSTFIGTSPASTCTASTTCLAMTKGDVAGTRCNSVLGDTYRHVGIMLPQYQRAGKTCDAAGGLAVCRPPTTPERMCVLPWAYRHGNLGVVHAEVHMQRVSFAHFNSSTCDAAAGRAAAVINNPGQPDYTPVVKLTATQWRDSVAFDDRFDFSASKPGTHGACRTGCDAHNFLTVHDTDGSADLLGDGSNTPDAVLTGQNPVLVHEDCASRLEWGAFACGPDLPLRRLIIENGDRDSGFRRIGPIHVTRVVPAASGRSNRTYFSVGPFSEPCSLQQHFGRFPMAVTPGFTHEMWVTGTTPANMRMTYASDSTSEAVRISLFLQKAFRVNVFVGATQVAGTDVMPTLQDPTGTNMFDPHARRLYLILRGSGSPGELATFHIRRTPIVAVTLQLAVTLQDFFADKIVRNLALLLQIDEARIKVVNVRVVGGRRRLRAAATPWVSADPAHPVHDGRRRLAERVEADVEIEDEAAPSVNDTETVEQVERLQTIVEDIATKVEEGDFDVGYDIVGLEVLPPQIPTNVTASVDDGEENVPTPITLVAPPTDPPADDDNTSLVLVAIFCGAGVMLIAATVLAVVMTQRYRRRSHARAVEAGIQHVDVAAAKSGRSPDLDRHFHGSNPMHTRPELPKPEASQSQTFKAPVSVSMSMNAVDTDTPPHADTAPKANVYRTDAPTHADAAPTASVNRTAFAPTTTNPPAPALPPVHLTQAQLDHYRYTQAMSHTRRP